MRRIALHDYLSQIEGLLDDNRLPEAAAHCHFVLQQYPRHIGAYRLFGRALLEQQLYDEAIDVFERLLSADPEDLISHAGLALSYSESRDLERAIWHMERAFEVDPYNRAIQDELRKLYIARDGDAPPRLALTSAALARLHLRGALYQQAVAEFGRLLKANPERVDLQLALAETLYLDDRLAEAADLCRQIVETLPFCIKANAMLADAFLQEEQVDEARDYLRQVQALTMLDRARLNPDTTLGRALSNSRITLPELVLVEVLEDTVAFAKGFEETGAWPEQATAVVVDGVTVPDWLHEVIGSDAVVEPDGLAPDDQEADSAEFIDWLDEALTTDGDADDDASAVTSWEDDGKTVEPALEAEEFEDAQLTDRSVATDPGQLTEIDEPTPAPASDPPAAESEIVGSEIGRENEVPVGEAEELSAPDWEDEQLIAIDDLRSYIDDDSQTATAESGSPDWLEELSEREDVVDELPQWLYEAVGLDAADAEHGDLSGSEGLNNLTEIRDEQRSGELSLETSFDAEDSDGIGGLSAPDLNETRIHEHDGADLVADTAVPKWLADGGEVLEELPSELSHTDAAAGVADEREEESTMAWLDELSMQLGQDEYPNQSSGDDQTGVRDDSQDDRTDE